MKKNPRWKNHHWIISRSKPDGSRWKAGEFSGHRSNDLIGIKLILDQHGYISKDACWSTWDCLAHNCDACAHDWAKVLAHIRQGKMKVWPKEFSYIPEKYRAEFTRAFMEGKVKRDH